MKEEELAAFSCRPNEDKFNWKHWEEEKKDIKIVFKKPREICNCDCKLFLEIDEKKLFNNIYKDFFISSHSTDREYFIKQTNIGDCFLVSGILSIINKPGIIYDLFYENHYTDRDEDILLYCYKNGKKEIINIKNTYPGFKDEEDNKEYSLIYCSKLSPYASPIPFTTSKNGVLLGQILIKCFICLAYLKDLDPNFPFFSLNALRSLNVIIDNDYKNTSNGLFDKYEEKPKYDGLGLFVNNYKCLKFINY